MEEPTNQILSSGNISVGKGLFTYLKVSGVGTFGKSDDTTYSGITSQRDDKDLDIINESEIALAGTRRSE